MESCQCLHITASPGPGGKGAGLVWLEINIKENINPDLAATGKNSLKVGIPFFDSGLRIEGSGSNPGDFVKKPAVYLFSLRK